MNTIIKTPEPPVILDRNQVAAMNDMYKRTFPGPWKIEVLKNYGLKQQDAEFITMIHARFPDFVNTVLALTTKVEQLELSNITSNEVVVDVSDFYVVMPTDPEDIKAKLGGRGLHDDERKSDSDIDNGTVAQEFDAVENRKVEHPEKRKRGRPRKVVQPSNLTDRIEEGTASFI